MCMLAGLYMFNKMNWTIGSLTVRSLHPELNSQILDYAHHRHVVSSIAGGCDLTGNVLLTEHIVQ